jgi:hypothetical protein
VLELLHAAERDLPDLLASPEGWRAYKLERDPPFMERMLRSYRDGKLYLHRIHPCASNAASYHPHPWPSAMRLVEGTYELSLGHGAGKHPPEVAARLIVNQGFEYEMIAPDAWHSVRPIGAPAMTVMVTGPCWNRPSRDDNPAVFSNDAPIAPLSEAEIAMMLTYYRRQYAP